ncbi:hypothetical protein FQA39_LY06590 [Lamprigera yunnana]|nr:hypothetical protein FQA39_LY06590 [Lamprigera yunnana]
MIDSLEDYLHFISDAPKEQPISNDSRNNIIATLLKKKECEARALKTLEFLIDGKIRSEVFFRCMVHLNRSYYTDIVEERSITKLCGYCLCDNKIMSSPKKRYSIDSKNNKIYDVTDRKKFCSDYCYKASTHIEKQIDDSPLWLREYKELPKFTLLPKTDRGMPGNDLSSELVAQKMEPSFESAYSFVEVSLEELSHKEEPKVEVKRENPVTNLHVTKKQDNSKDDKKIVADVIRRKTKHENKQRKKDTIQKLKQYIFEWLTLDSYVYLFGDEHIKKCVSELNLSHFSEASLVQQMELVRLCSKLELSNVGDSKFLDTQLKPIPSYKQLKKEKKDLNIKVRSFYSGSGYERNDNCEKSEANGNVDFVSETVPVTESTTVIRQNVFLNSVKNTMKLLSENLGISYAYVLKKLEVLVKTFALQPYSVVFQPVEWNLIALVLIKMLSIPDSVIREQINTTKSQQFIDTSVSSIPGIQNMLDELFYNINDIKSFLKNYLSTNSSNKN